MRLARCFAAALVLLLLCGIAQAQTANPIQFGGFGQPLTPYAPVNYFNWLGPNVVAPSELICASEINYTAETIPKNAAVNATAPTAAQLQAFRAAPNGNGPAFLPVGDYTGITGDYPLLLSPVTPPTTDMIIRWAACKWGVDENTLRALEWAESTWVGTAATNLQTTQAACQPTGLTFPIYNTLLNLPGGESLFATNGCWLNYGIDQLSASQYPAAFPPQMNSTAFSVDAAAARIRGCINGDEVNYFQGAGVCNTQIAGHGTCSSATGMDLYDGCVASRIDGKWWSQADSDFWNALANLQSTTPWAQGAAQPPPSQQPPNSINILTGTYTNCTMGFGSGCAKGDYRSGTDATVSASSSILTTPTGAFTAGDKGKQGVVVDWNGGNEAYNAVGSHCASSTGAGCYKGISCPFTVASINNPSSITVTLGAGCGASGIGFAASGSAYWAVYTDDSTALQNVINVAGSANSVWIPANYHGGLLNGATLNSLSTIQCASGGTFFDPNFNGGVSIMLHASNVSNVAISNCTFVGTQPTTGAWYDPSRRFNVEIDVDLGSSNVTISNNTFKNTWGVYDVGAITATNLTVTNNSFLNCANYGVKLNATGGASKVNGNIFSNCNEGAEDSATNPANVDTLQSITFNTMFPTSQGGTGYNRTQTAVSLISLGSVFLSPGIDCQGAACGANQYAGVTLSNNSVSGASSVIFMPVFGGTQTANSCTGGCSFQTNSSGGLPTPVPPLVNYFTLGPNATLPSATTCANQINGNPSTELIPANHNDGTGFNSNQPPTSIASYFYQDAQDPGMVTSDFLKVDGNFNGTTESILRWGACKWGVDEMIVRAQAWLEHNWQQDCASMHGGAGSTAFCPGGGNDTVCHETGDCDAPFGNGTTEPLCTPNLPVTSITPNGQFCALVGIGGAAAGHEFNSWSLLQTKVAFEWFTWPMIANSTPFAVDYHYATWRACMNGNNGIVAYFNSQTAGSGTNYQTAVTAATNSPNAASSIAGETNLQYLAAGCTEYHFTGGWGGLTNSWDPNPGHNPNGYWATVLGYMSSQPWNSLPGGPSNPPG